MQAGNPYQCLTRPDPIGSRPPRWPSTAGREVTARVWRPATPALGFDVAWDELVQLTAGFRRLPDGWSPSHGPALEGSAPDVNHAEVCDLPHGR